MHSRVSLLCVVVSNLARFRPHHTPGGSSVLHAILDKSDAAYVEGRRDPGTTRGDRDRPGPLMTDQTAPERPAPRRRRRGRVILVALAALLVVGGVALAGLWHVSARPQFCSSCHIMEPYVQAWKASRHGAVACVQCHYPPGFRDTLRVKFQAMTQVAKWATGTYSSKPFAEVEDASCLRSGCHSQAELEGKGTVVAARGVKFS